MSLETMEPTRQWNIRKGRRKLSTKNSTCNKIILPKLTEVKIFPNKKSKSIVCFLSCHTRIPKGVLWVEMKEL
jgi:hypothetical protein